MAQNIYDEPAFFDGYSRLVRSVQGLAGAPEWPALRSLLPALAGQRVLDMGCGYGWFCRWARTQGAHSVLGIDVSERMLARALSAAADPAITYQRADLEQPDLPEAAFDLAYSALALHYVERLGELLAAVHRALRPGGRLVFSVEHPIFMAPTKPGWAVDAQGGRRWPLDAYLREGPRTTDWFVPGVVKQHRTIGTLLNALIGAGFTLDHVEDWGPTDAQVAAQPELAKERERPMFLLVAARR